MIVIAFSMPGADLPDMGFDFTDKLAHFALFAGYGWLWMAALSGSLKRRLLLVLCSGLLLAVGSEVTQALLPYRSADPLDAVADTVGLLLAVILYALYAAKVK